jgi:hypothetical protein
MANMWDKEDSKPHYKGESCSRPSTGVRGKQI